LLHINSSMRHISYHDTSSIVVHGHYLATVVSLPPQFLLSADTPQYLFITCMQHISGVQLFN
jgi:hypothetical protein